MGGVVKVRTAVGILLLTLTAMGGSTAHAQYPPSVGAGRVTRSEVKQCQCTQFSGDGFTPGTPVTIVDRDPNGDEHLVTTVTADDKGGFKVKVCFDDTSLEGEHTLVARGTDAEGAHEDRATVTVSGTVCYGRNDEVHATSSTTGGTGTEEAAEQPRSGGAQSGGGTEASGVRLPRTGGAMVLPGLLVGFSLVVLGTGAVHATRRRRMATG